MVRRVFVAFCVGALAATGAGGAAPAGSGLAVEAVVFVSDRGGAPNIYAVNVDGTGLTQLTHDEGASSPLPSPDGTSIAFDGRGGATLIRRDGSGRRLLPGCYEARSWAPDSTRIACVSSPEGIAVADLTRGTITQVSTSGESPVWSPDGRSIAYVDRTLRIAAVDRAGVRRVGRRAVDGAPTWSPDSRRLAYTARVGERDDLFTIGADGSGERRVVKNVEWSHGLEWSPLGSRIAFSRSKARSYVESVYTVRPDGTGLRRVTRSPGGEDAREPSWSRDGTLLFYERDRYSGARDSDIFVTRAEAGPGRSLTGPFPAGGTNEEAHRLAGPPLPPTPPSPPPTLAVSAPQTLSFGSALAQVAADGARAAVVPGGCTFVVWQPLARRTIRMRPGCDETGVGTIVLSGGRVAWLSTASGNTELLSELRSAAVGGRRAPRVTAAQAYYSSEGMSTFGGGALVSGLRGGGGTIAFTFSRFTPAEALTAWLVLPRHATRCPAGENWKQSARAICRRLARGGGGVTAAADATRLVVVAPGGIVRLLATSGRILRTWTLPPPVDQVRLVGRTLAVQHGANVALYDTKSGAATRTLALVADEGTPVLLDVGAGLVVYATGGAIHVLRTSNGDDRALAIARAAPPLDAQLTPSGLFVTWNRMYDRRPGRLSFVPLAKLIQPTR